MGAVAKMDPLELQVPAGGEVSTTLTVSNAGSVVDEFTFEALGPLAEHVRFEPRSLRLLPDARETVRVTISPPRTSASAAGQHAFGVRITPREDVSLDAVSVEEGILTIAPFEGVEAELIPRTSRGRRSGKHDLAIDNRGNDRLNTDVVPIDPDELLEFELGHPSLAAEPGVAVFTRVKVKPRKTFWRGPDRTHPFNVELSRPDGSPLAVQGSMVQQALIPGWAPRVLLLALLALMALLVLWLTVLKPTIASAAREAVEEPLAQQAAAVDAVRAGLNEIKGQLGQDLVEEPVPGQDGVGLLAAAPFDERLSVVAAPGAPVVTDSLVVAIDATLEITDVILQNPRGNIGFVRLARGDQLLLEVALENFRDLDYHFVTPLVFTAGQQLRLELDCIAEVNDAGSCTAAAYVTGTLTGPTA